MVINQLIKKMKDYINLFHSILSDIHFWEIFQKNEKKINYRFF